MHCTASTRELTSSRHCRHHRVIVYLPFALNYWREYRDFGVVLRTTALAVTRWPDLGLVSVRLLANPPPAVHGTPRKRPKSFILASLVVSVAHCTCSYIRGWMHTREITLIACA